MANTVKAVLDAADEDAFPNTRVILVIGWTLPATIAKAENILQAQRVEDAPHSRMTYTNLSGVHIWQRTVTASSIQRKWRENRYRSNHNVV